MTLKIKRVQIGEKKYGLNGLKCTKMVKNCQTWQAWPWAGPTNPPERLKGVIQLETGAWRASRLLILQYYCFNEMGLVFSKRDSGGWVDGWKFDNVTIWRCPSFDMFCNWNVAPPSFGAFYDFCLQSLVSSSALYVNSSITLSKCSSSSKWEFCFKSKLSGHLIASTVFQLTK